MEKVDLRHMTALRIVKENFGETPMKHLDVGAGSGVMIDLFRKELGCESRACDFTDELSQLDDLKVDVVDLNRASSLPYDNESFDVATMLEVIEHIDGFRWIVEEMFRILKPGGLCILSTPNILNFNSRFKNLWFGFPHDFGPLKMGDQRLRGAGGHINPVSYFYIAHALAENGFRSISCRVNKKHRSAWLKLILLWPVFKIMSNSYYRKEVKKYGTIDESNMSLVREVNSINMLTGKTIFVSARKP